MSASPYTLNNLYNQGILDYVPYDLMGGPNVSSLQSMSNPYLDMASKGSLYQNAGMSGDSFNYTRGQSIGTHSNAGMNSFGIQGVGVQSDAGINGFGVAGVGSYSEAGLNGFGMQGVGTHSDMGYSAAGGGFSDVKRVSNQVPSFVKGIVAGAIILGTTLLCFKKGKKKAPKNNQKSSFWSKLQFWKKNK